MARIRSVDFLPEIFQTSTTTKFLNATLDQLIQEPKLKQTQGYIGRKSAPGKLPTDGYILEPTDVRTNYQLEPGVVFKDANGNVVDALTYIGLIDGLETAGANVDNHNRLFSSETYSWSPYIDFDKVVNYSQYFWLPDGPNSVNVSATTVLLTDDFEVIPGTDTITIEGLPQTNPVLTLLRGGTYNFNVSQAGSDFYIQTHPGVDGTVPWADNISSREILGVTNNGEDDGTINFVVPDADAQLAFHDLVDIGTVDIATPERMDAIADVELATVQENFAALQDIDNKTIIFLDDTPGDAVTLGWVNQGVPIVAQADRYQIYRIQIEDVAGTDFVRLWPLQQIDLLEQFTILYGEAYSNVSFYKKADGYFAKIPLETASLGTLYYQDASDPNRFGVINIIVVDDEAIIDVDNILGRETYTSPNGVIFTNGLKVKFRGDVLPVEYAETEYYVEGVGTAIQLVAVTDLIVPETYAVGEAEPWDINPWDSTGFAATSNSPTEQDYITINRTSLDLNGWTRSNRWFHYDVLVATADYNGVVLDVDTTARASRPVIEFDANLRLINYGTVGKHVVNVIDFNQLDAFSNVNGAIAEAIESGDIEDEASIDGYKLGNGSRVIFAADLDPEVRNRVYEVELVDANGDSTFRVNLVPIDDGLSEVNDIVLLANGLELQGKVYTYDGTNWIESQAKTGVNQAPLFDIFDIDGNSLTDETIYSSTTFVGSKIFSYAVGTGVIDSVLGFPIRYLNIDNLGDIVFENNLYTDTFSYGAVVDAPITSGFARKYYTRTEFTNEFGWVPAIVESRQSQIIEEIYTGDPIQLDITPLSDLEIPAVKITANGTFVTPDKYTVVGNIITFISILETDAELIISVLSDEISEAGYYEVPSNLSSNMFNENTSLLTLGTIRNHYNKLAENIIEIEGFANGANNLRDLGGIEKYGTLIVQQSAPIALAAMFMRDREYNFFSSVEFASRQYEKFKNQIINWVEKHDVTDLTTAEILDTAIKDITVGKTINSAFYWSDMLPTGSDYETTEHIITAISTDTFITLKTYDFTVANTQALLVYHNDVLLTKDTDYTVATDGPRITLLITPVIDDIIKVNEYDTTLGSNVPSTPTKLGLFPRYVPLLFEDDTYVTAVDVIRGHDGSITVAHGDFRDDVLLEFERRVYNNIKVTEDIPIELADVVPGVFRETDYTDEEVTQITAASLLAWLGWNRINYKTQEYNQAEEKTWNYSSTTSKITNEPITKSNWRGIYISYYDTDAPHIRPWEMVGLTERPDWWNTRYGSAPYTSGNLVLWDDMEAGLINEPGNERVDERYIRPGLTTILPVDGEGNLVMPLASVVSGYIANDFKKSWSVGDVAPAEAAWRKSSAYPFAVQRLYALTKPAQYFALMADRDRYKFDTDSGQYLYDERQRLDSRNIELQDDELVKHSYINWILDYNKHYGYESLDALKTTLSNLDVNLCHHMASFTDKNNLKIFTDKSSPDSTNSSLLLPDESFNLLLYKNQPMEEVIYSSVIVQKVEGGYSVTGNSTTDPYFKIQTPIATGRYKAISTGNTTVQIPMEFTDTIELIPYSRIFSSKQAVSEFLISYSEYLERTGIQFNVVESAQTVNWSEMIQEFLYWANQGWAINSIINLNPAATEIEFERELVIVDDLNNLELTEQPQNQNREPLDISDYVVDRIDNNFKIRMIDGNIISYLKFNLTSFEHLLVLDNTSIFNDLIYDPVTGVRQHRVKLSGFTTYEWNGQLDAQGFLYNEDNVKEWAPVNSYNKGDIVKFKNSYWSAAEKVQPSETFNFSQWVKTNYDQINKGLLPNLATKADQMLQYYNNKTANLESDIDLMAYGLTGFRSRDYLRALDLDDISQVNIYSNLIETKGTPDSLTLFKDVTLNNETVDYTIFENWALKRAEYGATASRRYIDLQLNDASLTPNPSLIEIVDTINDDSVSDLLITVDDIYKQSVKHTDKNIFTTIGDVDFDTALPTAGFVKAEDVDVSVFDISEVDASVTVADGTLVWVAKDTEVDWNVYRATAIDAVIETINDNLDGTLTLITDQAHNLTANTRITVLDLDDQVNGTHNILSVSDSINIVIAGELANNQTCVLEQTGNILEFITARVNTPSDIAGSIFDSNLSATDTVWASYDNGKSAVYEKTSPFSFTDVEANPDNTDTDFGASVAQGFNDAGMLVGDPLSGNGVAHFYTKDVDGYTFSQTFVGGVGVANYGNAVALIESWGAIAASGDATTPGAVSILNNAVEVQTLVSPNLVAGVEDSFGTSIAMSKDENWLYVGEPLNNEVHVYHRIDTTFDWIAKIDNITIQGVPFGATDQFGASIDISTNSKHIVIGAPGIDSDSGKAYVVSRVVERFIITDAADLTYSTIREPLGTVFNNSVELTEGTDYSITGFVVTVVAGVIGVGDSLEVDVKNTGLTAFHLIQELPTTSASATFGNAVQICKTRCSVYVGAENDNNGQGSVTRYVNTARRDGILTSTEINPTIGGSSSLRVNGIDIAITGTSADVAAAITAVDIPNIKATETAGVLTIELVNKNVRLIPNRLEITMGFGTTSLADLGFAPYEIAQTLVSPTTTTVPQHFGSSLTLDLELNQLAVGAPDGIGQRISSSADSTLIIVEPSDITVDAYGNTGVVYTYDLLSGETPADAMMVLGQEIYDTNMYVGDKFGSAINLIDGVLVAGSVNYDSDVTNVGRVVIFDNPTNSLSWIATATQNDVVDVDLISGAYMYNDDSLAVLRHLDYIDPLNGKILGAAAQNIDFITAFDPTVYNDSQNGLLWSAKQVGAMWWNISNVRFQDYTIGDAVHASKVWGRVFAGSTVDIYQWVESSSLPVDYTGTGTILDEDKYVTVSVLDKSGLTKNTYYYWVNKVETISVNSEKTLSASAIASYIESPISSGISYATFIAPNLIGLYNCKDIINNTDSILHVEYTKIKDDSNVFVEYDLFRENHPTDFLSDSLYKKLQDSMCGIDTEDNVVPDPALSLADRYGIDFRPRKSMFIDRYAATSSYLKKVNGILAEHTITESRSYPLLNSEEALPAQGSVDPLLQWNLQVADNEELSFQDLISDGAGYRYLVVSDSTNAGLWAIYEVTSGFTIETLDLIRVQTFDTTRYWSTEHWYASDFSPFTKVDYVVNEFTELATLGDIENNAVAKVVFNSVGSWELYQLTDGEWNRTALENGTIRFDERLWTAMDANEPVAELREVIKSINEELLVGDLATERSRAILSVFNYVLSEQPNVDWLQKTSLIDVTQKVRGLAQYAVYQKDNQDYLNEYLSEAKPYHTKIKDFSLNYDGFDLVDGNVTDFDCPSTYSTEFKQYISPILDDGAILVTDPSNKKADDPVWQERPWQQWFDNHTLSVAEIVISNPGTGYVIAPEVVVTGDNTTPAVLTARVGLGGTIVEVIIEDAGSGYLVPPIITFEGGSGADAVAIATMQNTLVRTFKTSMKYDRYEYVSKVALFEENNVTSTRNLVFKYDGTIQEAKEAGTEPTLYRLIELYVSGEDNNIFNPAKFEAVAYITTEDGTRVYTMPTADTILITADNDLLTADLTGLDKIEQKYFNEGLTSWYETEDANGDPSGEWFNENDNSESRNFARYNNKVYKMITFDDTTVFSSTKYEEVDIAPLSGIDRTTGFYVPDVNNPGLDLSLLFNGIAYPGVEVSGDSFTVTEEELDTIYESEFLDTYLGTRPTDINVDGGEFIDDYHSHAPEELVPGAIFDTLNIKVFSRPGSDFLVDGHAFLINGWVYSVASATQSFSFADIVPHPITILAANVTTGKMLYEGFDYTVNWQNQEIDVTSGTTASDNIKLFVYEIGGGNQLYRGTLRGTDIIADTFEVPVLNAAIQDALVFVNGVETAVTTAHVDNQIATVTLPSAPLDTDFITVTIFGTSASGPSYPLIENWTAPATVDPGASIDGKSRHNAIVSVNGLRLRPPGAARTIADGVETQFLHPTTGGYTADSVSDNEVDVYLNDDLLAQGIDYTNGPLGEPRYVELNTAPSDGDIVDVYIRKDSDYWYSGTEIVFNVTITNGDLITVTTFRDVTELDILTQTFVGPTVVSQEQVDTFEAFPFDSQEFDFALGINTSVNVFTVDRELITNKNRLWLTVNGERLHAGSGFEIVNSNQIVLFIPTLLATDVVVITSITENIISNGASFRLFKDMRDTVGMYKMTNTYLTQDLADTDDIIHVSDASVLGLPDLTIAKFGIVVINGERITYREQDLINNTVSGLRRGTAGTGAAPLHPAGDVVYDASSKSAVQWDYDRIWYAQGDGTASDGVPLQDQLTIPAVFIKP